MAVQYIWTNGQYKAVGETQVSRQLKVEIVDSLPTEGSQGVMYIVPQDGEDIQIPSFTRDNLGNTLFVDEDDDNNLKLVWSKHLSYTSLGGGNLIFHQNPINPSIIGIGVDSNIPRKSELATVATTGDYNDLINRPEITTQLVEVTQAQLHAKELAGELMPGQWYAIIDYAPTWSGVNFRMQGHSFDILVLASSTNELNKNILFRKHINDSYFTNCDLTKWTGKLYGYVATFDGYTINGYVIDELTDDFNNTCPYDFKNVGYNVWMNSEGQIQFDVSGTHYINLYTFGSSKSSNNIDYSIDATNYIYSNKISYKSSIVENPINIFFGNHCSSNMFGDSCKYNTFSSNCTGNTLGDSCEYNTFGDECHSNTFGDSCKYNTFRDECTFNTFGNGCCYNTFSYNCRNNILSNSCEYDTLGNNCSHNTFGNNYSFNIFGDNCYYNTFGNNCSDNTLFTYARYNIFENGVKFVELQASTSGSSYLQNIKVCQGVQGTSSSHKVITEPRNLDHQVIYRPVGSEDKEI